MSTDPHEVCWVRGDYSYDDSGLLTTAGICTEIGSWHLNPHGFGGIITARVQAGTSGPYLRPCRAVTQDEASFYFPFLHVNRILDSVYIIVGVYKTRCRSLVRIKSSLQSYCNSRLPTSTLHSTWTRLLSDGVDLCMERSSPTPSKATC